MTAFYNSCNFTDVFFKNKILICLLLILTLIFCTPGAVLSQNPANNNLESQVKAAYLYNFTKFVNWNLQEGSSKPNPIVIYVFGNDPIGGFLDAFLKNQPEGNAIIVKMNRKDIGSVTNCQLLFISQQEQQKLSAILKQVEGSKVLTVSDIPGFVRQGGMIGFFVKDYKVKIEINLNAVNNAGLKISAKLLEVARIVPEEE